MKQAAMTRASHGARTIYPSKKGANKQFRHAIKVALALGHTNLISDQMLHNLLRVAVAIYVKQEIEETIGNKLEQMGEQLSLSVSPYLEESL